MSTKGQNRASHSVPHATAQQSSNSGGQSGGESVFHQTISHPMKNPIVVALDVDDSSIALKIADQIFDVVGGFKIGPRLLFKYGPQIVRDISDRGPVFLDNKHFDIPSTMLAAVQSSFDLGASLVTVHALAGSEALSELAKLEAKLNQIRPFKILCVTVLTSWSEKSIPPNLLKQDIQSHVNQLVELTVKSGLSSIVCSPIELKMLRSTYPDKKSLFICTPGVRFDLEDTQDQKRVMSPKEAMKLGSNILVVGRPIIQAANVREAATEYVLSVFE